MRLFETESIYNKDTQEWEEVCYIDGEEVDFETYCEEQTNETIDFEEDECCNCEGSFDCMIEDYVTAIQMTDGCPSCIRDILLSLVAEMEDYELVEE